ncbi:hypothetical protein ACFX11_003606 [Malus domestica]
MTDIGLQAMKKYQYDDDPVLATCGISINKDLIQVKGGVLETQKVCMEDERMIFVSLENTGSSMIRLCFANSNVACKEYKRMGPEEEELRLKYLQFVQEDVHAAVCFTNLYC